MSRASEPFVGYFVDPFPPLDGVLAVVTDSDGWDKGAEIEMAQRDRFFRARASFADHLALGVPVQEILKNTAVQNVVLHKSPLTVRFDQGGDKKLAVPFTLHGDEHLRLLHADVFVKSNSPRRALYHARAAHNRFADCLSRRWHVPLVITRIDLFLEHSNAMIAREFVMPFRALLEVDPFVESVVQTELFASTDALLREAITSQSPYYRLLCAYKLHEAVQIARTRLKSRCVALGVVAEMPKPTLVTDADLQYLRGSKLNGQIKNSNQLFDAFHELRNRIAHFLLMPTREAVPQWEGQQVRQYSIVSALLLRYADADAKALASFHASHVLEPDRLNYRPSS